MIVPFYVKLNKFYCIGVMNWLKVIYYDFLSSTSFVNVKISYYWFNRRELLEKDTYHNRGGTEKTSEYYMANKDVIKKKANSKYRNLSEEEKEAQREYRQNRYKKMKPS